MGTREARLRWPGRGRRSGDSVRPPSLAYALVIGDIGGAVVAETGPGHLGAEDDKVTVGGTLAAAGRAERAHQRAAVLGRADDIRGTVGGAIRGDAHLNHAQHNGEGHSARRDSIGRDRNRTDRTGRDTVATGGATRTSGAGRAANGISPGTGRPAAPASNPNPGADRGPTPGGARAGCQRSGAEAAALPGGLDHARGGVGRCASVGAGRAGRAGTGGAYCDRRRGSVCAARRARRVRRDARRVSPGEPGSGGVDRASGRDGPQRTRRDRGKRGRQARWRGPRH